MKTISKDVLEDKILELEDRNQELTREFEAWKQYIEQREKELSEREEAVLQKEQSLHETVLQMEQARRQQAEENKVLVLQKENLIEQLRIDHTAIFNAWLKKGTRSDEAMEKKKAQLERRIANTLSKREKIQPKEQWV